jgi:pyruvate formate lyase activating enzyme
MQIAGFEKNTLLDYPGKVASIIFTYGCNLRCPYCHNPELVIKPLNKDLLFSKEEIINYLKKRKGLIDALVITGGEPLLQKDLIPFIKQIKELDLLVKLDTNGTLSDKVKKLVEENIVDYWAMDVKFPTEYLKDYGMDPQNIKESIDFIMNSNKEYEFRTTYVKGLHKIRDAHGIGEMIKGSKKYYIQNFRKGKSIDSSLDSSNSFTEEELNEIKKIVSQYVKKVEIR